MNQRAGTPQTNALLPSWEAHQGAAPPQPSPALSCETFVVETVAPASALERLVGGAAATLHHANRVKPRSSKKFQMPRLAAYPPPMTDHRHRNHRKFLAEGLA